jgi:hypothetical protein
VPFSEALTADPRINAHLDATAIAELLEPSTQIGLSAQLAGDAAERARQLAAELGCVPPTRAAQ